MLKKVLVFSLLLLSTEAFCKSRQVAKVNDAVAAMHAQVDEALSKSSEALGKVQCARARLESEKALILPYDYDKSLLVLEIFCIASVSVVKVLSEKLLELKSEVKSWGKKYASVVVQVEQEIRRVNVCEQLWMAEEKAVRSARV